MIYAEGFANDWNTKDAASGYCSSVTKLEVEISFAKGFEVHTVGSLAHEELWVQAEQLDHFNGRILGQIEVVAHYYGEHSSERLDPEARLPGQIVTRPEPREP